MNVLVIPSWYPPRGGSFCREQAEALAACTDCNIIVADWGQNAGALPLSHPLDSLRALWWRAGARREIRPRNERCFEFFEPTLIWSPSLPGGGNRRIFQALRRIYNAAVKRFGKIDLFHAHVCQPGGYLAALLSAATGVPFVVTEHWGAFPGRLVNGRPQPEIETALGRAAAVVSVSRAAAKKIAPFGCRRLRVIPNPVDETRFVARPFPGGTFRFFSMGGITQGKGFDVLLQAIARWSPSPGEVEFVIAGEGAMEREFRALAEKLKVGGFVRWAGPVSRADAPRWYQDCHAFVLPSRSESLGMVYIEAIASGRPVIATRCGGPEDIVNDTNGFLVPVEDVAELAAALARMKEHHSRFDPAAIRADFMNRFSRPVVTAQIRRLYSEVLAQN